MVGQLDYQGKRRFGKVRTLPNLLNSSHAEKGGTPTQSCAGKEVCRVFRVEGLPQTRDPKPETLEPPKSSE